MRDFSDDLASLQRRRDEAARYLRIDDARARVVELEQVASEPDLWDDPDRARAVTSEMATFRADVELYDGLAADIDDVTTLHELAVEEADDSQEGDIADQVAEIGARLDAVELRSLFSGEWDERDAVVEVHAGEGGTDAQDWAEMLLRMYSRWAEGRGLATEVDDTSAGREAGILSATFLVRGRYAYGMLRGEQGVHRLVRMSPFDAASRRQTSFASIDVTPFLEDDDEVTVEEKDLRVDTYRSSGAGGQHVNVTDSAVRLTHLPTGVVVSCQNERSQHQNKARAMQILQAKLAERQREERRAELEDISGGKAKKAEMGSQIRSYVLAPYMQVKDLRTGFTTGNVTAVLEGDLDPFVESYLRWDRQGGGQPS